MTATKEVTKREAAGAVALPEGYLEDFPEGYDEADHVLPVISIVQPTSGEDKKALGNEGQFVSRDGAAYDALRFVLISVQYGRGLAREFEGHQNQGGAMWICYSDNRRLGYPNDVEAVFANITPDFQYDEAGREVIECAKCPHSADNKNWIEGGCRYTYTLRCFDLVAERPFAFFVKGTAMSPIRAAVIDRVTPRPSPRGPGHPPLPPERPFWWAELEMTTTLKQDRGSYYVPVVRVAQELDAEKMAYYSQFYSAVRTAGIEEPESEEQGTFPEE